MSAALREPLPRALRDGRPLGADGSAGRCEVTPPPWLRAPACASAHASGRARPNAALAATALTAATTTPRAASSHQWLAVTSTTNVTSAG